MRCFFVVVSRTWSVLFFAHYLFWLFLSLLPGAYAQCKMSWKVKITSCWREENKEGGGLTQKNVFFFWRLAPAPSPSRPSPLAQTFQHFERKKKERERFLSSSFLARSFSSLEFCCAQEHTIALCQARRVRNTRVREEEELVKTRAFSRALSDGRRPLLQLIAFSFDCFVLLLCSPGPSLSVRETRDIAFLFLSALIA